VAQHAISQLQKFAGKWLVSSLTWLLDAGEQGDGEGEAEDPEVLVDMVSDTLTMLAGRAALKALDKNYKFPGLGGELIIREPTADVADIGFQTWGAGVVLARYVTSHSEKKTNFAQTTILELGSGTGLAGLLCARIGRDSTPSSHSFHMTLTDYNPAVLDTLVYNARANNLDDVVDVSMLDWRDGAMHSWPDTEDLDDSIQTGDSKRATFDYVIASDVAYDNAVTLIPAVVDRYLSYEPHGRFWCVVPRRQRFNAELAAF
ncbi:putative methyltransferase-domain-containing protein, partial [Fimicolochytrium jonesii]|uniref:putative methyltransferase-domain-containing protein n=1 Tax=Fimicolochytrium jonesii TaxID=1396493 RepID=UPI0022FF38BA